MLAACLCAALAVAVGLAGYVGGRQWRLRTGPSTGPAGTVTVTAGPTPGIVGATPGIVDATPGIVGATPGIVGATPSIVGATPDIVGAATGAPAATATPPPPAPIPRAARVAAALQRLLRAPALGPSVHALVVDAATGRTLFRRGAATAGPPASTTKLATATALLGVLGATQRLTTRVVAGSRRGQIVLVGGGDPTLSAAAPGHSAIYPGAARMSALAAQVRASATGKVTAIVVDSSLFTGPDVAPGWQPEDVPSPYASAITATVVDAGRSAAGGAQRSAAPDLEAGRALALRLGVPRVPVTRGRAPRSAVAVAAVQSPTVLDLVEQMLANSDNVIAEMLGRQVARVEHQPMSFAGAVAGIRRALATLGIAVPATLADASGLSERDRLSPRVLVNLLRTALLGSRPELAQLISALPVAGWEGTLGARYRLPASAAGAGRVRAKTGTLSGVVTLAGIVADRSGRVLAFAVMADRVAEGATAQAEAALDVAIARLARCGCR